MQNHEDIIYPYKLFFYDCIWEGNKIIYPASNCNAICETNIMTGETTVIGNADEGGNMLLFHGIYKWKNYLIMPSRNARTALHLFNLETREWSYIMIAENKKKYLNFREENVFEFNGYLYIFPFLLVVLKIDIEKKSIEYLFYPDMQPDDDVRGEITFIKNMIYIPIRHKNKIYKFDLNTEQWGIFEVNIELNGIDTLCFDGKSFWMTGIGQMICSWDEKSNTSVSYKKFPERFKKLVTRNGEKGYWFNRSIVHRDSIYFVPSDANMIIKYNIKKGETKELFIEDEWEKEEDTRVGRFSAIKYMGAKKKDNMLMLMSNKNKNLIFIDMETESINKVELILSTKNGLGKLIFSTPVIGEEMVDLTKWLECVSARKQQYDIQKKNREEGVGKKIYSCD